MTEPTSCLAAYQSIKRVLAGEIIIVGPYGCHVRMTSGDSVLLAYPPKMTERYQPVVGDWWIVYPDGYQSICPKAAFDAGYFLITVDEMKAKSGRDEIAIEAEIQANGLNAPRLTPALIDAVIVGEDYHVFPGTALAVCCLKLRNGFTVTGESAAASPENFDVEIGRKIARENARQKIWALEGYALRERLSSTAAEEFDWAAFQQLRKASP